MTTLNRKIQPNFKKIDEINIAKAISGKLQNNIPIHYINDGTQDVVRIDFVFRAGDWYSKNSLQSASTNAIINEGSKNFTAFQIAENIDFYGAYVSLAVDSDNANISLFCLTKNLEKVIPIVEDFIKNPTYSQKEFENYIRKQKNNFITNSSKVKVLARRKLQETMFGKEHPYSNFIEIADFDNLKVELLRDFHKKMYSASNCEIMMAGRVTNSVIEIVDKHFGKNDWLGKKIEETNSKIIKPYSDKIIKIEKADAVQNAIRIGKATISQTHEDFMKLQVLNTVLGGYFGSRLMSNIREDKGYTYGIGSMLHSYRNEGMFAIVSEVGAEVCEKAVNEIYFELNRLCQEQIPEQELDLVRNFMLGDFVRMFDGPFAILDSFKAIHKFNLDYEYYNTFIETIKTVSSKELMQVAQKYFNKESLFEVTVGKNC